jgi:diguanylate cyclase (GGDEF)-like protein
MRTTDDRGSQTDESPLILSDERADDWMRTDESGRFDQRYVTLTVCLRWSILIAYVALVLSGVIPMNRLALLGSAGWILATNVLATWYWTYRRPIHWYDEMYLYLDLVSVVCGTLASANLGYPIWMAFVMLMIQAPAERPTLVAALFNAGCVAAYAACAAILYAAGWYAPDVGYTTVTVVILTFIGVNLAITFDGNRRLRAMIRRLAVTDALTGLANRRQFSRCLANPVAGTSLAVIVMDVDRFKQYNDSFGHLAGDQLLVKLANLLEHEFRDALTVARYGGDEFVVLLPCSTLEQAELRVSRLLREAGDGLPISCGIAMWPDGHPTLDSAFAAADDCLRAVKRSRRGTYALWSSDGHITLRAS